MAVKKKTKLHVKPTSEELDQGIDETVKKLEEMDEQEDEKPEKEEEEVETPDEKEEEEVEEEEDVDEDVEKEAEDVEKPKKKDEDYKEKFVQSAKEAQILHARNKKLTDALDEASQVTEPTEEEMLAEYPEWEMMTDSEKKLAKKTIIADRRFEAINKANVEMKNINQWNEKVAKWLDDPENLSTYPEIDGNEDEFLLFATKPTRRGIDFEDLVSSFLYTAEKTAQPKKKGKMLQSGSGGPDKSSKPKSDKISLADARALRETDYKKYAELLKAGKIADE